MISLSVDELKKVAMELGWQTFTRIGPVPQVYPGDTLNDRLEPTRDGEKVYHLVIDIAGYPSIIGDTRCRSDGVKVLSYTYVQFPQGE